MADLEDLVFDTAKAMLKKLYIKERQGFAGWDDPAFRKRIECKLRVRVRRAARNPEKWLDVANLAAMLWYGHKQEEKSDG